MTANHPEDLVARLTARASSANGNGRPAGGYWPDDAELDRQAAATVTSLVGERDALRAAVLEEAAKVAEAGVTSSRIEPSWLDEDGMFHPECRVTTHGGPKQIAAAIRALASPHQEGTEE